MNLLLTFLVAIGLSMDAFSLSLLYGTLGMNGREKFCLSFVTGVFHFFMPLLGLLFGNFLFSFITIDTDIIVMIILCFIGVQMIFSSFKDEEVNYLNFSGYFLFAVAVSIDSFSVGITLSRGSNLLLSPLIFSTVSFTFTFLGLFLGDKIYNIFGKISTIIGGFILVMVGLSYLL